MIKNIMENCKKYVNSIDKRIIKYGDFNSYDLLKNIALLAMVMDHLGYFFFWGCSFLRLVGRITILVLAVLYGFSHKEGNKPRKEILIFAIITTISQFLFMGWREAIPLNVLYNFYISAFLLDYLKKIYREQYWLFLILIMLIIPLGFMTNDFVEYGTGVVFLMFCGQIFKQEKKDFKDNEAVGLIFLMFSLYQFLNFQFNFTYLVALQVIYIMFFILLYNFKFETYKQRIPKIFFMISRYSLEFYTLHLIVFMFIFRAIKWLF